jgi:hypothetical protein
MAVVEKNALAIVFLTHKFTRDTLLLLKNKTGSMVLTIGTYSMFFGLPYAAGMVGLIAVHGRCFSCCTGIFDMQREGEMKKKK